MAGVSNDDVGSSAGNYSLDLRLVGLGYSELVKCLLQIVEKGFPLCRRYHEMLEGPETSVPPMTVSTVTRSAFCRSGIANAIARASLSHSRYSAAPRK